KCLNASESEPRAFERRVAETKTHRPRLGDLLDFVEIARGAVPIADAAEEGRAGDQAAGNLVADCGAPQSIDCFIKTNACCIGFTACGWGGVRTTEISQCEPKLRSAKSQRIKGTST